MIQPSVLMTTKQEARVFEEKKMGVKGVGRKTTDESEHISWRDGVIVPCGKLVPSANKDGPLEYNEYAVYDPKQVCVVHCCCVHLPGGWLVDLVTAIVATRELVHVVQVSICFLVGVKYEEQNMEVVPDEE